MIDTALLIVGALMASRYFDADTPAEAELRSIADLLYRRIDWCWSQHGGETIMQGWKPECGFLHYGWEGYSEAIVLYRSEARRGGNEGVRPGRSRGAPYH